MGFFKNLGKTFKKFSHYASDAVGSLGSQLGGVLGSMTGNPIFSLLGNSLGSTLGAYGDYQADKEDWQRTQQLAYQQFDYSKQLAQQQNDLNFQFWQKQQEYNTPAQQMDRLLAAGINPLFGGVSSGNAGALQPAAVGTPPDLLGAKDRAIAKQQLRQQKQLQDSQIAMQNAQILSTFKDVELKEAQRQNIEAETEGKSIENVFNSYKNQDKETVSKYWKNIMNLTAADVEGKVLQNDSQRMANVVTNAQLSDEAVFDALVDMPRAQHEELSKRIQQLDVDLSYLRRIKSAEARRAEAEACVQEFYANCANAGIDPHAPWLAKLTLSILNALGISTPEDMIDQAQKAGNFLKKSATAPFDRLAETFAQERRNVLRRKTGFAGVGGKF